MFAEAKSYKLHPSDIILIELHNIYKQYLYFQSEMIFSILWLLNIYLGQENVTLSSPNSTELKDDYSEYPSFASAAFLSFLSLLFSTSLYLAITSSFVRVLSI